MNQQKNEYKNNKETKTKIIKKEKIKIIYYDGKYKF